MVGRLEAKGALSYTEGDRARLYSPNIPRSQAALQETESLLHRVYHKHSIPCHSPVEREICFPSIGISFHIQCSSFV